MEDDVDSPDSEDLDRDLDIATDGEDGEEQDQEKEDELE
jgi:hypothetical protein